MNWEFANLGDVVDIIKGRKPDLVSNEKSELTPNNYVTIEAFEYGIPVQFASVEKNSILTDPGAILVVWDGARFGMVGRSIGGVLGSTLAYLKPIKQLNEEFLFYFLLFNNSFLRSVQRGAGIPHLDSQFFRGIKIPLPSLSEQLQIVKFLREADEIRDLRKLADEKTSKIIPALFYEMFGDPFTSKIAMKIGNIITKVEQKDITRIKNLKFQYIDISSVDGVGGKIISSTLYLSENSPSRARQLVKYRDVIVSTVRPYLKATALVPQELNNQVCSTGFCVLRSKEDYGFGFLYALSRLDWFSQTLMSIARGAAYPAVSNNDIFNLTVPYPKDNPELIRKFDKIIADLEDQTTYREKVATKINSLHHLLLSKAFDGSLTVSWREAHSKELLQEMEEQKKYLTKVN